LPAAKGAYVGIGEVLERASVPKDETKPRAEAKSRRDLPPAAIRALAEAAERRRLAEEAEKTAGPKPKEVGGPAGPEPTRYGDWERKGIASDF
jgi:hypothetical protein